VTIHPTAIVSPLAHLGQNVSIGPFTIIEDGVTVGDNCRLEARVSLKQGVTLGNDNWVCEGTVIGGMPQHVHVPADPGQIVIGTGNVFREHCTVHRPLKPDQFTRIGNQGLFMAGVHVAHDCKLGSNLIIANNALLGGHVTVDDRAYISGGVAVHQFCRIGCFVMIGGQARIVQDVPPFVTVDGQTGCIVGLNLVGLRRNGFDNAMVNQLKEAYRIIYRRGLKWTDVLAQLQANFTAGPVVTMHKFLSGGTRGFVQERRLPPGATLKLRYPDESASEISAERKVG